MVSKLCSNGCQTENNKIIGRSLEERGQRQSHRHRLPTRTTISTSVQKTRRIPQSRNRNDAIKRPPSLLCRGCVAKVKKMELFRFAPGGDMIVVMDGDCWDLLGVW